MEGLKSQNHCLCSLQDALRKFKSPRGWTRFSRLNFWRLAVAGGHDKASRGKEVSGHARHRAVDEQWASWLGPSSRSCALLCEINESKGPQTQNLKIIKLGLHPHTKPTCPRGGFLNCRGRLGRRPPCRASWTRPGPGSPDPGGPQHVGTFKTPDSQVQTMSESLLGGYARGQVPRAPGAKRRFCAYPTWVGRAVAYGVLRARILTFVCAFLAEALRRNCGDLRRLSFSHVKWPQQVLPGDLRRRRIRAKTARKNTKILAREVPCW